MACLSYLLFMVTSIDSQIRNKVNYRGWDKKKGQKDFFKDISANFLSHIASSGLFRPFFLEAKGEKHVKKISGKGA